MSTDTFNHETHYTEKLSCSKNTKDLLMTSCKEMYLRSHPEMEEMKITQGFLLKKIVEFYLKAW